LICRSSAPSLKCAGTHRVEGLESRNHLSRRVYLDRELAVRGLAYFFRDVLVILEKRVVYVPRRYVVPFDRGVVSATTNAAAISRFFAITVSSSG
jgi:hypothetical protein